MTAVVCPGCGLAHEPRGLPPVPELSASGECRAESAEVLAAFYEPDLVSSRQYVIDAYACTHPDATSRRGVQTTALCLMTMDLYLECGQPVSDGSLMHQEMMRAGASDFTALDAPPSSGCPTHRTVHDADRSAYAEQAAAWAVAVWELWSAHHEQVRDWNLRWVPHRVRRR